MNENKLIQSIDWQKINGLLPVIVQDFKSSEVLMLGYMNEEALRQSLAQKKWCFFAHQTKAVAQRRRKRAFFALKFTLKCEKVKDYKCYKALWILF